MRQFFTLIVQKERASVQVRKERKNKSGKREEEKSIAKQDWARLDSIRLGSTRLTEQSGAEKGTTSAYLLVDRVPGFWSFLF
jgi:hypothetical protein